MTAFRTTFAIEKSKLELSFSNSALLLGSCFAQNMGDKLTAGKLSVDVNPFGIIYNPLSIRKSLEIIINNQQFSEQDLFYHNEQWHSFWHHSDFSNADKLLCQKAINERINNANQILKSANFLFITFGTSWVYLLKKNKEVVSNCHKLPADEFERKLLTVDEIVSTYNELISKIKSINPTIQIVFTVSPIRHFKDGVAENQLSKSTLILAVHQLKKQFSNVDYFPAYELMNDDLRDYRFYAEDMIHPNSTAIEYIWKKFSETYLSTETIQLWQEVSKIVTATKHRPFNSSSESYKTFKKSFLAKIQNLKQRIPYLNLEKERLFFEE